jgi:3,4-dihydroxy 2-butanone 4-phosphate synthase/GTP cyclohydrolase II
MIVNLHDSPVNLISHLASRFQIVCDEKYQSIKTVERAAEAKLPTKFGEFRIIGYHSLISDEEFVVLTRGVFKPESPALLRIHSQCLTGDVFGSVKCDCGQQLEAAMKLIAEEGCGAIVYQQQEGRGIGIIQQNSRLCPAGQGSGYN